MFTTATMEDDDYAHADTLCHVAGRNMRRYSSHHHPPHSKPLSKRVNRDRRSGQRQISLEIVP